nr:sterol desaturase family protein [Chromobacterium sp. ASV5]
MNVFALTFLVMLAMVLLELFALRYWRQENIPWREIIFNLNSGHIVMWIFRGAEVAGFDLLLNHANLHLVDRLPVVWQWIFAFIAWDLSFYCMHRAHHTWRAFWAVHVVHHQGEHFSLSLGIRNSWYSSLTSFLFVAPLAMLGLPLEMFVIASSFHYAVQLYNHNAFVKKSGWLDKVFVTPSNHRVHHAMHPLYINKNFGGTFLIWDKLFGSYQAELDDIPLCYGVAGDTSSYNPFWASNQALHTWMGCRLSAKWLSNCPIRVSSSYIAAAGILLFCMVIYYVNEVEMWNFPSQLSVAACLTIGTIAIGGMSDGKRWGWICWLALTLIMPALCIGLFDMRDTWALSLLSLLFCHGLAGLRLKDAA